MHPTVWKELRRVTRIHCRHSLIVEEEGAVALMQAAGADCSGGGAIQFNCPQQARLQYLLYFEVLQKLDFQIRKRRNHLNSICTLSPLELSNDRFSLS